MDSTAPPSDTPARRCRTCGANADRFCEQAGHDVLSSEVSIAPTIAPSAVERAELFAKLEAYVAKLRRYASDSPGPVFLGFSQAADELGAILAGTYDPREAGQA